MRLVFSFWALRLVPCALCLFITSCAHEHVPPTDLRSSVAMTRQAIALAKHTADSLPSTPATSSAISDLRQQLADVGVSFDALTGKVQWYETDWARLNGENGTLKKENLTLRSNLHQTAKERDFYPFLFGLLAALLVGIAFGPWALKLPGIAGFIVPPVMIAGGGLFGFTASRMLAAWGCRFLPG